MSRTIKEIAEEVKKNRHEFRASKVDIWPHCAGHITCRDIVTEIQLSKLHFDEGFDTTHSSDALAKQGDDL